MRIFLYEWRKLFQRKAVWIFVVVLLCVNSLFIVREITNNEKGYSLLEVRRVYDDLMHVPESEKMKWLEERLEYLTEQMASRQYDMSGYVYRTYTKTCAQENLLISYVYQQAANQQDYNAYLEYVREQSDQITQLAVFAQPDSYSYRNMLRVKEVYQKLEGVRTVVDFSDGVKLVTDWRWTDVFLLCAIFPLLLNLLVSEREEGTLSLIKPTKNGYSITIWAKIVVMVSLAMLITLLFYGANFMLSWLMVGFGDLGRPIQGLDGYLSSPALMTVGKYLLCFLWAKMIGILTVVCVVGFLCVQMKSSFYTILFSVCISGAEILCWKQIDSRSWIWPLAQFNFASLLDTGSYFSVYENMNLAGYPVNGLHGEDSICRKAVHVRQVAEETVDPWDSYGSVDARMF